ncbi:MAG: C25 family cysteine peptidase, partial [bacterium]
TVEYERDASSGNRWYDNGTGIASAEGPGHFGEYDYQHMNLIRNDLLAFTYTLVDQIYDPGATASQVTTALNGGRSIVNYCGHGSQTAWGTTGFSNTHVNALVNDNMLPFIISVACQNGNFASGTCFAEAWLRAMHGTEPSGALATYMSSIDQSWNPPMDAQDEAVDLLRVQSKTTFGGICFNGSCKMIDINGSGGVSMFNTWHIFGDPSVQLRTGPALAMSVSHAAGIALDATTFDVTVSEVVGALCALSNHGTLFGAAYTDATGSAVVPIEGTLPEGETVKLTVTAFNKITYLADVFVMPLTPAPVEDLRVQVDGDELLLSWTSTGAAEYRLYSDSDPYGSFSTYRGATSDTSIRVPIIDEQLFFMVVSSTGN